MRAVARVSADSASRCATHEFRSSGLSTLVHVPRRTLAEMTKTARQTHVRSPHRTPSPIFAEAQSVPPLIPDLSWLLTNGDIGHSHRWTWCLPPAARTKSTYCTRRAQRSWPPPGAHPTLVCAEPVLIRYVEAGSARCSSRSPRRAWCRPCRASASCRRTRSPRASRGWAVGAARRFLVWRGFSLTDGHHFCVFGGCVGCWWRRFDMAIGCGRGWTWGIQTRRRMNDGIMSWVGS